jgi:hypothetical protein
VRFCPQNAGFLAPLGVLALGLAAERAAAQNVFVERGAAAGLVHRFACGLDRAGALPNQVDWVQVGLALGDLDGDGDADVVCAGRLEPNHVFRNDGGTFTAIDCLPAQSSEELETAVALGDYDRDGDLDLFVADFNHGSGPVRGACRLYRNDGAFQFADVSALAGIDGNNHTVHAKWYDLDRDGWLDLYLSEFCGTRNLVYRNNGDGGFSSVGSEQSLDVGGSTHVVAVADLDGAGDLELLIGNDWQLSEAAGFDPNPDDLIFTRLADASGGTWLDVTPGSGYSLELPPYNGATTMGIAFGDVDYDGDLDCYKTLAGQQALIVNHGWPASALPSTKEEVAYGIDNPVAATPTTSGTAIGWGCAFQHFDLDRWIDLYKVNGKVSAAQPRNQQNYFFWGLGPAGQFHFTDRTVELGLAEFVDDRGLAVGDPDRDGDVDLLIAPPGGLLRYYVNQLDRAGQGFLAVEARTLTSAPNGIGTLLSWTDDEGYPHLKALGADGQTASQDELLALFGLGHEPEVDLVAEFPSGMRRTYAGVARNTFLTVEEPEMIRLPGVSHAVAAPEVAAPAPPGTIPHTPREHVVGDPIAVRAFAHAQDGAPLGAGAAVEITAGALAPVTPTFHVAGNEFRRLFARPALPGVHAVSVSFDGWMPRIHPELRFVGTVDAAASRSTTVPEGVRVGTSDTFELVYVPRDALGTLLGAGHDVTAEVPGVIPATVLADRGDGSYAATFSAPNELGEHKFDVSVDGTLLANEADIEVAGAADPATSVVYVETPNPNVALNPSQLRMLVTPKDAAGMRLGWGADVTLAIVPGPSSKPVQQKLLGPNEQADGDVWFVIERPPGSPVNSAFGTFEVIVDGIGLGPVEFVF